MANEIPEEYRQKFIGLLTHEQKQAGYFVSQDEDFIYLWRSKPHVDCIAIFLYDTATVKEIIRMGYAASNTALRYGNKLYEESQVQRLL